MSDDVSGPPEDEPAAEGIAIIGMAGRFPGASDLDRYWQNLRDGVESISFFSREELEAAGIDRDLLDDPLYVPASGALRDIDRFDAAFFDYSPREAELMDPQYRVLLECAWEALEKAGYDTEGYGGSIGMFGGMGMTQYLIHNLLSHPGLLARTGRLQVRILNDKDFLAASIAFRLNLTGPSITVQTACSTSLVAVCLACQSLLQFQCDMALAGGVSIAVPQPTGYPAIESVLSPDGHCRAFDARARGTVEGSGAGLVVLKRLSDALADGDTIHAVIKGFATNNDGSYKVGFTAPSVDGQIEVVAMAQAVAGVSPDTITFVEAHGTGTPMGDPIEVTALSEVFAAGTDRRQFCALGSVKTNLGHLDAAAGVASLIKTALALERGVIPPSLHFETPNPEIDFANSPFFVNREALDWRPEGFPRRAGVSAFALGGVNAHLVLEEAPPAAPGGSSVPARPWQLLVLSARTATALETATDNLARHFEERPGLTLEELADAAFTLQAGRRAFRHRRAVVCRDAEDARAVLAARDPRRILGAGSAGVEPRDLQVAFLLPGLGNHHVGMARDLYRTEPGFRDRVDDCAERLLPLLGMDLREAIWPDGTGEAAGTGAGLDLRGLLGRGGEEGSEAARRLSRTALSQPAVFVVEYALAGLWMDWGVEPRALLGFSVGEYVAACLAGVMSLDDALRLVAGRARLIDELPGGAMLAVPLSEAEARGLLGAELPDLSIAAVCGPDLTVLAGPEAAVGEIEARLTAAGHVCRRLQTAHAFHSRRMDPAVGRFLELFRGIELRAPEIPFLSNVTGTWITPEQATSPAYWAEHLRGTVRFADAVAELWREPGRVLLEAGPGQTLSSWALQHPAAPAGALAIPSLRHSYDRQDDRAFLLGSLARLWLAGLRIDWTRVGVAGGERRRRVPLPTYPFERQRYWIEAARTLPPTSAPLAPGGLAIDPGPFAPSAGVPPATVTGVTARAAALPGGEHPRPELPVPFAEPRGEAEARVAEILREILHLDRVGIHDGFFDLGGDSLLATRLIARLNQSFGAAVTLRNVFESPTAAELAVLVGAGEPGAEEAGIPLGRIPRRADRDALPGLSFAQQRMWVLDQLDPGNPFYNVPGVSELLGPLDPAVLARCFVEIVRRHESLRTTFPSRDGRPLQVIAPPPEEGAAWPLPRVDLAGLDGERLRREVERLAAEEAQLPFDLARGPLIRTVLLRRGASDHVLLLTLHHIVSDGWSNAVVTRELTALYQAFADALPSPLPELPVQYADFAEWQAGWLQGETLEREVGYWRERLAGSPPHLDLPADRPRPALQSFHGARLPFAVPPALTAALARRGRERGATLFMAVLAGLGALLARLTGQTDLPIGSPVANRRHAELEELIGFFVNTLVLRLDLKGDPRFGGILERARETAHGAFAHQDLPFEKLVEEIQPERDLSRSPLFQVMLVLQKHAGVAEVRMGERTFRRLELDPGVSRFDLLVDLEERDGALIGGIEYTVELFDRATVERLAGHLLVLLEAAVEQPDLRLSALPLLRGPERRQILEEWSGAGVAPVAPPGLLHSLVEEQARLRPGAVAVEGPGAERLTYEELNGRADRLAGHLRRLGLRPETRVALSLERSPEMAVSVLAVLKAGGACVPLDPSYPEERRARMREDAGAKIVLRGAELGPERPPSGDLPEWADAASLAYVLFTSGSTGRPKGVAMSHGALSTLIAWQLRSTPGPGRTLQFAPLSFDVSFQELFATWAAGGTLVLAAEEVRRDPAALWAYLAERSVERLFLPFVALQQLAEAARSRPGVRPPLREVVTAGEALQITPAVAALFQALPAARLHNQYGPTETHVVTAETLTGPPDSWPALPPIGRPVDGDVVRVLDPGLEPCPAGVPGELYLGGAALARGYLGRPDETAARFVPDPYGAAGERLYRTGDRARFRADGRLEYLGRLDAQVKVRGFRIEPGEVEAALTAHPGVAEAAVTTEGEGAGRRLVAWVVPRGAAPDASSLRTFLAERLPEFLVPSGFGFLAALPLTPSGKVARRALPRLADAEPDAAGPAGYVAPRTPVEEVLAGLWSEILGSAAIGVFDDFFARGGHSLIATQLLSRVRAVFGVELPLRAVFEAPTVAGLAERIERERRPAALPAETPPPRADRRAPLLPLSFAQERLWFLDRLEPGTTAYNIPSGTEMVGDLDPAALAAAVSEVVRRHEALRTRFEEVEGAPWQRVMPAAPVALPLVDLSGLPAAAREREAGRLPRLTGGHLFDLSRGPLFFALLVRLGQERHRFLVSLHHIVADGWSSSVLLHEISALYPAFRAGEPSPLAPLPLQYTDFAVQQRAALSGEHTTALPADRPHPPVQTFHGASVPFRFEATAAPLGALARAEGATLFMVLLAAFQALLSRYGGQEDIVVGSPVAGRNRRELEGLIGCFINTLPFRADLSGDPPFRELLARVREAALEAFALQELPFERLVGELQPVRDLARPPLFQTMLILQNTPPATLELPGLTLVPLALYGEGAKLELLLSITQDGGALDGYLEYNADLFDPATAGRILGHFQTVLAAVAADPGRQLSRLAWLPTAERQQVLVEWNDTGRFFPRAIPTDPCLHHLFEEQARRTPEAVALVGSGQRLTYAELEQRSGRLAGRLCELGVGPEVRVGVCLERTPELVVALLAVLRAGGAYVPLDPAHPAERRAFLVRDTGMPVLVARPESAEGLPLDGIRLVTPDEAGDAPVRIPSNPSSPSNLAYLIYTSGSTGVPKGVAIPHRSAVALLRWAAEVYSDEEVDGILASTSIGFDLSVFELFVPLTRGGRVVLAENGLQLPALPEAGEVRLLNTVPSVLSELLRLGGIPPGVVTVNLAGEPLRGALVEELHRASAVRRVYNLYGPSEDTTYSTWARLVPGAGREPSIGRPIAGTRAFVADPRLEPMGIGVPGELCLAGAGLARGYLDRPALTAERFAPDPFSGEAGARLYRTGDLARLRPDGEIEFLGRIDNQVKLRGFRIEPGEIEAALALHPAVAEAAVVVVPPADPAGDRRLVAHVVLRPGREESAAGLRAHLQSRLPAPMIPSAFTFPTALPLTPNGKVDRRALVRKGWAPLRAEGAPGEEDLDAAPTPLQAWLMRAFGAVLGIDREGGREGIRVRLHDNFFDLGGHSLLATRLLARAREALGIELPLRAIFEHPTPARLARRIAELEAAGTAAAPRELPVQPGAQGAAGRPLSFAQHRLWFVDQLEPGSPLYNIATALWVSGPLRPDRLARCLGEVERRHEILRTTFAASPETEGVPVQGVHPAPASFLLPVVDLSGLPAERREAAALGADGALPAEAGRPFDLGQGPLWRALLVRLAPGEHLVLLTLHHIVSDGWSIGVLVREVGELYEAFSRGLPSPLPGLPLQYADFAARQRERLAGEVLERELAYWRRQLAGAPPVLELPADRPRGTGRSFRGGVHAVRLPAALVDGLQVLARAEGATLFMALLAAFQAVLARHTGERDIAAGTPVAGRNQLDTERLIGLFINTLVLRTDLSGDPSFLALLARVREVALAAQAHAEVPFERLVEELAPGRSLDRTPLFQVLFLLQNLPQEEVALRDLTLRPLVLELSGAFGQTAKFDLTFALQPVGAELHGVLKYNAELFDAPTIARLAGHLETLLAGAVEDPGRRMSGLPLLTPAETALALREWNDSRMDYPCGLCLHEIFERCAAATPGAVAVALESERRTYAELDREAGRLAAHLRTLGVGPEVPVAICAERSLAMVAGLLAILKAGGAYVPLDPEYPRERLAYLLADSGAPVLLVQERLLERLPVAGAKVVLLDAPLPPLQEPGGEPPPPARVTPDSLAYVIYTSGSTGQPKGVAVHHRGAVNRIAWAERAHPVTAADRVLQIASFSFDFSVWELFAPLLAGGTLVLAVPGGHRDAAYLARTIRAQGVTIVHFVPSMLQVFLDELEVGSCDGLRNVLLGGEALSAELRDRFFARLPAHVRLWNEYGPTETSIDSTARLCRRGEPAGRPVPIGRPIANSTAYVLDPAGAPVPAGVAGELFLGGDGVARGYLGRPALTAERFLPDPFGEPGGRLYRTGDRARWRADGEIDFLGRLDHQVKIRGVRIELGEVESLLLQHPSVRDAAAVVQEAAEGPRLAAFVVEKDGGLGFGDPAALDLALADLRSFVRERLPAHLVPAVWTVLPGLPLTPAGKLDRRALARRSDGTDGAAPFAAPRTASEGLIAGVWAEMLGRERVGVRDDFFALGGHSLLATRVASRLRALFRVELPLRALFEEPTVEGLAARVEAERARGGPPDGAGAPPPIRPVSRDPQGMPLSFAQERLWFIDQLEPGSALYNIPVALRVTGPLDPARLERCLAAIEARHEVLRTVFPATDGPPLQRILPAGASPFRLAVADLSALADPAAAALARVAEEIGRPFDLGRGPVWRALLLRLGEDEHLAVLTLHHIASDGWSMSLLVREVGNLYVELGEGALSREPLPIQYADFAVWQRRWLQGDVLARELAYWRGRLSGAPAVLELPADRPRPPVQTYRGALHPVSLPPAAAADLQALARREGATPFMVLLAAFEALLGRLSGRTDLTVGSPVAGRNRIETEGLIGFFVNTLVLRADLAGDPAFRALAGRVREDALGAQTHQDVPFEKLVEELAPERSLAHSPLFQVMFSLQNTPREALALPGLTLAPLEAPETLAPVAKFDLTLTFAEVDGGYPGSLEYATDLFDPATAARFAGAFVQLLGGALRDPEARLADLPLLAPAERVQIALAGIAPAPEDAPSTAHGPFEARADADPAAVALEAGEERWTYGELEVRANRLAHRLRRLGVRPEATVAVALERSAEAVGALLAVWKAGGVYLPLDPAYPEARRAFLLRDSGAAVLLTRRGLAGGLSGGPGAWRVLFLGEEDWQSEPPARPAPLAGPENLAYLIYTSGSTGEPKAVAVEHGPAAAHFHGVARAYGLGPEDRNLQFAALSFDVSLEQIGSAFAAGAALVLRGDDLWSAAELSERVRRHGVTVANLPTAYWQQWGRELAAADAQPAPSLRLAVPGGEALTPEAARFWLESPATAGVPLLNAYGPTEAVMTATHFAVRPGGFARSAAAVPVGRPLPGRSAHVLDALGSSVPDGVPGELCLGGLLARGYLGRPGLTAERFLPDPFASLANTPGARLYRTGDRARRLPSGDLDFLGRMDHQVKVRGFRIELGEIEAALGRHPQVLAGAVLQREDHPGDRRLVAYVASRVPAAEIPALVAALREHLGRALPPPLVPAAFVVLGALPLTPTGKIDRRALPAPALGLGEGGAAAPGYTPPRNPYEEVLAAIWSEVLGVDPVGIHDNFFELGGHSLLATQVSARLRRAFRVELALRELFEAPTVAALAARVEALMRAGEGPAAPPIRPLPPEARAAGLPLSFAQQRLWLIDHLETGNAAYNVPFALRMDGPLRPEVLRRTFSEILRRHEVLRTVFALRGGEPVQVILPPAPLPLPLLDLEGLPEDLRWDEVRRLAAFYGNLEFDLSRGPVFRACVVRLEPCVHALISSMHHIVSDEWSARLLFKEVVTLYGALAHGRTLPLPELPELPIQYADFAVWQRQWLSGEVLERQLAYWRGRLGGDLAVLELPADRPRPPVQTFRGSRRRFAVADPVSEAVRAAGRREGASLFMTLLAAFYTLLRHLTGQSDLAAGTPVTGRNRVEVESLIGFFLNTLVLRADLSADPGFRDLLRQVRETSLQAYAHQDVPFEKLVDELKPKRSLSHSPLFQALFVLLHSEAPSASVGSDSGAAFDLQLSPFTPGLEASKFDLTLSILSREGEGTSFDRWEGERVWGLFEYNTDLFDDTTVLRWGEHFQNLLAGIAADPDRPLSDLPLLAPAEVHQIAREWNDQPARPEQATPVHLRVAAQAARTPERPALLWDGGGWSYAELDGRAAALAAELRRRGVGPDDRVAVCAERGPGLAAALLATFKAGGAYVPLDPAYPRERLAFMLADAGAKVLLVQEAFLDLLPLTQADRNHLLNLDQALSAPWEGGALSREAGEGRGGGSPDSLSYLIYTSGSTGLPKGTALPHATLANLIGWQVPGGPEGTDAAPLRTLQFVSPSFDVSLQEVFATWCAGGTLILAADDVRKDPERLLRFLAEERIERLFLPYVALQQLAEQAAISNLDAEALPPSLREIVTAGERLQITPQIAQLAERLPGFRERGVLRNQYGPAETHVVTEYNLAGPPAAWPPLPPIGRPIPGAAVHVLDRTLRPVPLGVAGELALGGVCLARGYLNRPDLTAARFIPDALSGRPGERLYRTGDLVRRRPAGDLEFLGRIDHQVKVRGFRIEPGEIEVVLASHPQVQESAVVVREDGAGDRRLIAYVVSETGGEIDPGELRDFLRERLPAYMVPAAFLTLRALPLTASGKVDRAALPAPEGIRGMAVEYVEPKSGLEWTIAAVLGEILGLDRVGIEDNFFDLGVHSLLMVRASNALTERLGRKVQVLEMFRFPTVAALAQHLGQEAGTPEDIEAAAKEQFEQRAEARRQGARRRDRRGRRPEAPAEEETEEEPAEVAE